MLDLGLHRLKDLRTSKHLYQLAISGLRADFSPLHSLEGTPNNLPVQVTSFVGREKELVEIAGILNLTGLATHSGLNAAPRLITLIGPGGTGKTRLSLQAAAKVMEQFPDGVWLVELAPFAYPEHIVPAIAYVFNLQETPYRPLETLVLDYLSRRKLLLVLDNCEHLIDECARLADLILRYCPGVFILASSREALGIAGERSTGCLRCRCRPTVALPATQTRAIMPQYGSSSTGRGRSARFHPHRRQLYVSRADLPPPGRHSPGHRTGCGTGACAVAASRSPSVWTIASACSPAAAAPPCPASVRSPP